MMGWRRLARITKRDPREEIDEEIDEETDEEIRFHFEMCVRDYMAHGLTQEEAQAAAHKRFGDQEPIREKCVEIDRRARSSQLRRAWASDLMSDLRFGARILVRAPGFSLMAIATLAIGIGATTAIFSLFHAVLISPLPYPQPEQLVQIWARSALGNEKNSISGANAAEWREAAQSFSAMGAYRGGRTATLTEGDPELVIVGDIQPSVSRVLAVPPLLGRSFVEEDAYGDGRLALLSFPMWAQHFGSDSTVVGRIVTLDDLPYAVIGVMPRGFNFPADGVDLWMPLTVRSLGTDPTDRGTHALLGVGRLRPGLSLDAAQAEMTTITSREGREYPEMAGWGANLVPLQEDITADARLLLTLLLVGAGLVLFVACGNLANLLLARAVGREHEIAVRGALGAGRTRILRQLFTESLLLAVLGGGAAVFVSFLLLRGFIAIAPADVPLIDRAAIDTRMLVFAGLLSVTCALVFGLAPALHQTRSAAQQALRGARDAAQTGHARLRGALLVTQVSLAVVLLIGAGLFIRTLAALTTADIGFDDERLVTMSVVIPIPRYPSLAQQTQFFDQLLGRVRVLPGVDSASGSIRPPGFLSPMMYPFVIEGRDVQTPSGREDAEDYRMVAAGYFGVIGQRVTRGRSFTAEDRADTPPVVVVNEAFARKLWPDEDPVGQRIAMPLYQERSQWQEVVGVVSNARLEGPDTEVVPRFYSLYAQHDQIWQNWMTLIARVRSGADQVAVQDAMRGALLELDSGLPARSVGTVQQFYRAVNAGRTFAMTLAIGFALSALLLSVLGLYGLISFSVAARTKEIGLRMALGANRTAVVSSIVRQSLALVAAGTVIGTLAALAATRSIESMLFGVTAADGATYAATLALVLLVSVAAASLPAWRASRISPVSALSAE